MTTNLDDLIHAILEITQKHGDLSKLLYYFVKDFLQVKRLPQVLFLGFFENAFLLQHFLGGFRNLPLVICLLLVSYSKMPPEGQPCFS